VTPITLPNLAPGEHAYLVGNVIVAGSSRKPGPYKFTAAYISPLRGAPRPPFGWGMTREAAVADLEARRG
jgi:hypothetical protein